MRRVLFVVAVTALLAVPLLHRLVHAAGWALALQSATGQQWAAHAEGKNSST
jgi:hypothetical protein